MTQDICISSNTLYFIKNGTQTDTEFLKKQPEKQCFKEVPFGTVSALQSAKKYRFLKFLFST
jgi:hypothetical protein